MVEVAVILILAALVGGIPYLVWIIRTAVKRNWRKFRMLIVIPLFTLPLLLGIGAIADKIAYARYLHGLFDATSSFGKALFEYDSERGFQGDGYSFSVYPLPDSIRSRFQAADEKLMTSFPERPGYRDQWETLPWRSAPFDPSLEQYLDFSLSSLDSRDQPGLEPWYLKLREALKEPEAFYAFFHKDRQGQVVNIDFFAIDLKSGLLYMINHNT